MSRLLLLSARRLRRFVVFGASVGVGLGLLLTGTGCGAVGCPEGLSEVDGVCQEVDRSIGGPAAPLAETCDGVDNDGDDDIDCTDDDCLSHPSCSNYLYGIPF